MVNRDDLHKRSFEHFFYRVKKQSKALKLPLLIDRLESFFRSDFTAETSEPATISVLLLGFNIKEDERTRLWNKNDQNWTLGHSIFMP